MMYQKAIEVVEKARHITIIGHINPDADTIGTGLGLWWILKKRGRKVDIYNASQPLPQILSFLPAYEKVRDHLSQKSDLFITVDCASYDRLGIEKFKNVTIINIDHHRSNTRYGDINLLEADFSCSAEVAFRWITAAGWEIPKEAAIAFYVALISDTGYFGYEGVGTRVFDFAKSLVLLGADPAYAATMLRENLPLCQLRLLPKVLETLKLYLGGRVAGLDVTQKMLKESGASINETEDLVNYARSLATVEVGFLVREEGDGSLKVSLRSKREVDVGRIAVALGGGGHKHAAGFVVKEAERSDVVRMILERLEEELHK